jgi:polygalacturonase
VIVTADDSICIKTIPRNGKKANTSENITVTNCVLTSSSTPLMIGTETHADIKHVVFNNCVIRNSIKALV